LISAASTEETTTAAIVAAEEDVIGFRSAMFTWDELDTDGKLKDPKKRDFRLSIDGSLTFDRGTINLIIGPTGSGKTSLLFALLGTSGSQWPLLALLNVL
jgi:ABC-type transport system involved in cytochrome bd biosynthesis fused ATPase/permease subunit